MAVWQSAGTERWVAPLRAGVALGLGLVVTHGFGLSLVPALLPQISDSLDTGYAVLGLAVASGLLAYSLGALASGWVLSRAPNRAVLVGSFVVAALALLTVSAASSGLEIAVAAMVLGFNAGVSWPTTLHVIAASVSRSSRTPVMASAGGGVGLGIIVNGVLVQTTGSIHSWRVAFVIAATIATAPVVASLVVFRHAVPRPHAVTVASGAFRSAMSEPAGRVALLAATVAGLVGFPYLGFLSAVAIDEFGTSSASAASLWWIAGAFGIAASPVFGRFANRTTPLLAIVVGGTAFLFGLVLLLIVWGFVALALATVLFTFLYYPVWGLAGSIANDAFDPHIAVRAVALGLVGAAIGGSVGNAAVGAWFESSGSFRGPALAMCVVVAIVLFVLTRVHRSQLAPAVQRSDL